MNTKESAHEAKKSSFSNTRNLLSGDKPFVFHEHGAKLGSTN